MKLFVSVDMEGVAGIVDWAQCLAGGDDYALGRDLLVGEVNAAIDGAVAAGATDILINDAHSVMRNLPPESIGGRAAYLSGRFKPLYMMVITGDQYVGPEATPFCPGITAVRVKVSLSRFAARHEHPHTARDLIRDAVRAALADPGVVAPPAVPMPATIEIRFTSPDMAEQATWVRGVSRIDPVTVTLTDDDPLRLYRAFITLVYLTRSLVEVP